MVVSQHLGTTLIEKKYLALLLRECLHVPVFGNLQQMSATDLKGSGLQSYLLKENCLIQWSGKWIYGIQRNKVILDANPRTMEKNDYSYLIKLGAFCGKG